MRLIDADVLIELLDNVCGARNTPWGKAQDGYIECFKTIINNQDDVDAVSVDRVLEIIDEADDENCNEVGVVQNNDMDKAYAIIYERVSALKGSDEE